jgi:hypothetical protein
MNGLLSVNFMTIMFIPARPGKRTLEADDDADNNN